MYKTITTIIGILALMTLTASTDQILTGSIGSGPMISNTNQDSSSTYITFSCNDPVLGYYDMCITSMILVAENNQKVLMRTDVNPIVGKNHQNILFRALVFKAPQADSIFWFSTEVMSPKPNDAIIIRPNSLGQAASVVYTTSSDGGKTWADLKFDLRPANQ